MFHTFYVFLVSQRTLGAFYSYRNFTHKRTCEVKVWLIYQYKDIILYELKNTFTELPGHKELRYNDRIIRDTSLCVCYLDAYSNKLTRYGLPY